MTSTSTDDLTGPRWSAAAVCPRRCVYGGTGAPAGPTPDWLEPYYRRGKALERIVLDELDAETGQPTQRQVFVPWPAEAPVGEGHGDGYEPHTGTMVEVVTNASGDLPARKALQVAGYALNHPEAKNALVVSLAPQPWQKNVYPIDLEGLYPQVREIEDKVLLGLADPDGNLPHRVCRTPRDGPAMFCPYVDHCFEGWEWPGLDDLLDGDDILFRLADAVDARAEANAAAKEADKEVKALQQDMEPLVPANEECLARGIQVKRTEYETSSFSLASYLAAGHPITADMEPFVNKSTGKRWTVKRHDDAPATPPKEEK